MPDIYDWPAQMHHRTSPLFQQKARRAQPRLLRSNLPMLGYPDNTISAGRRVLAAVGARQTCPLACRCLGCQSENGVVFHVCGQHRRRTLGTLCAIQGTDPLGPRHRPSTRWTWDATARTIEYRRLFPSLHLRDIPNRYWLVLFVCPLLCL